MLSKRGFLESGLGLCFGGNAAAGDAPDPYAAARMGMLAEIDADMRETAGSTGRGALSPRVRAALARVPRHRFMPASQLGLAYANQPLPIGEGQTISQPFIVALMTELLEPQPADRVLEIGTGSGYQAAVLAELVARVFTIEIVRPLGERARELLRELGHANIETRIGDGHAGWPDAAPFDKIVVTAAPEKMPQPLVDQLAPGGRLIAPVGPRDGVQNLLLLRRQPDGRTVSRDLLAVRFVPLTRGR